MKINTTTIKTLQSPESGYTLIWDSELKGFGIRVTAAGAKAYIVQARVRGKDRRVTLGKVGVLTPDEARKKAKRELVKMSDGRDPVQEKRQDRAVNITLAEIAADYRENRRTAEGLSLKPSTLADITKHLAGTFADWKDQPIVRINRDMVKKKYAQHCKRSIAQANQSMRVLRALINYAAANYRDAEDNPIITENPVRVLRDASMLRKVAARKDRVPDAAIGRWWSAVEAIRADPALSTSSRSAADLVALLALTGLRLGEARALRWEHVDLQEGSLILHDTKNRTEILHLPLSAAAVAILEPRRQDDGYVFPARSDGLGHITDCRGQLELIAAKTGIINADKINVALIARDDKIAAKYPKRNKVQRAQEIITRHPKEVPDSMTAESLAKRIQKARNVTAHDLRRTFSAVAGAVNVELWRTKALMGHKQKQDVTLHHYKDLSDVRFLKPEADLIAGYYAEQRHIHEAGNVVRMERRA